MISDNRLRTFAAVAQEGSITEAARRLGISQPAVSQCIAQLESETGGPLFERIRSGVALTPRGRRFLHYALRILALYDSLDTELSSGAIPPESASLRLDDQRTATVSASDGKITIEISK